MAYLVATVAYNLVVNWHALTALEPALTSNLGIAAVAIVLLLYRRAEAVYLLAAAFVIGLSYNIVEFYRLEAWLWLRPTQQVGIISAFVVSFAVVAYMATLARRGILTGHLLWFTKKGSADERLTLSEFD